MRTRTLITLVMTILLLATQTVTAQRSIKITSFKENLTNYGASYYKVLDNNNEACARIRFSVPNSSVKFDSNLGVVKTLRKEGEVWVYVPQGTKVLTLRSGGAMLRYEVPVEIQSMVTYDANVEISGEKYKERKNVVYEKLAYSIYPFSGPELAFGLTLNHHNIEVGGVVGLKKSDALYFSSSDGNVISAYRYYPIRLQARYGYELTGSDGVASIIPQVGAAFNLIKSSEVANVMVSDLEYMKWGSSLSVIVAMRIGLKLSKRVFFQVTPECDFTAVKGDACKVLNDTDKKIKRWTEGFNVNAGLIVYF